MKTTLKITDADGQEMSVTVREVRMREIPLWHEADDLGRLSLVTDLTDDQVDELPHAAILALLDADDALNSPLADRWLARQRARQAAEMQTLASAMPEVYEQIGTAIRGRMEAALTPSTGSAS